MWLLLHAKIVPEQPVLKNVPTGAMFLYNSGGFNIRAEIGDRPLI
jgi:hypothetical protein